jgi:hypothetical protein
MNVELTVSIFIALLMVELLKAAKEEYFRIKTEEAIQMLRKLAKEAKESIGEKSN